MKKILKTAGKITAVVLAILTVAAYIIIFPLFGKKNKEVWDAAQKFDITAVESVTKKADKPFKILLLSDLQLWMRSDDNKAALLLADELVEKTMPDMIVLIGDNISGVTTNYLVRKLIKTMDKYAVPWAPVFGNHESEGKATVNWQGDRFLESAYCLFQKGPSNLFGSGNYAVNITDGNSIIQTLIMTDNSRKAQWKAGEDEAAQLGKTQREWYRWNIEGIARTVGVTVPSMVFAHIPVPEMQAVLEKNAVYNKEQGRYILPAQAGSGKFVYLPSGAPVSKGFFDIWKELGSTKYYFCGHDHENCGSLIQDGITMTYGLKTGPSPRYWNDAKEYGGTVITIGNAQDNYAVSIEHVVCETLK